MSHGVIRRADSSGDTILAEWDTTDEESVARAREVFDTEAAKQGILSRCDDGTGMTGTKIDTFDPEAAEILSFGRIVGG